MKKVGRGVSSLIETKNNMKSRLIRGLFDLVFETNQLKKNMCEREICVSDGIKELTFFLLGVKMKLCSYKKKSPYFIENYVGVK